jgi:CIC family chloride channel protein
MKELLLGLNNQINRTFKTIKIRLFKLAQFAPRLSEGHFLMIISVAVGVLTALAAILFHHLILFFEHVFLRDLTKIFSPFMGRYSLVLIPAIGAGIAGIILHLFAKDAKGHGIPEVIEAVALHGGRIRPRVSVFKMITSSMTIGSGGSSGQEGPIIQIGSAIGSGVGQLFGMSAARNRHLLGCGAAAGIAAIFNAPIAGVIFALEAIIGEFTARVFSPIVIAAVVASVISRSVMGSYPIFKVPAYQLISPLELINYVILGILCGIMATIFIKFLYFTEDIFNKGFIAKTLKVPEPLRPFIGGLGVGFLGLYSFYLIEK